MRKTVNMNTLGRWRLARRLTLRALLLTGAVATAAAISHRVADGPCSQSHGRTLTQHHYTYSGIGVEMAADGEDIVVRRVFPGTPAEGKLASGAKLLSIDGVKPADLHECSQKIRGPEGSPVTLEVAYSDARVESVTLTRQIVRLRH